MTRYMVGAVVGLALALVAMGADAQGGTYVAAPGLIGPAQIIDWHTAVDLDRRTVTVSGVVANRSDVVLTSVRVGLSDEDVVEVPLVPATLAPGESGVFRGTLYTGTNLTLSAYVMADPVPVVVTAYAPWGEK